MYYVCVLIEAVKRRKKQPHLHTSSVLCFYYMIISAANIEVEFNFAFSVSPLCGSLHNLIWLQQLQSTINRVVYDSVNHFVNKEKHDICLS